MTHAIGTGTCNVSINVCRDERAVLGRAAFAHGARSVGDFLRQLILAGLEAQDREAAARLREVRARYYGVTCLLVFVAGLCCGLEVARRRVSTERVEIREESGHATA